MRGKAAPLKKRRGRRWLILSVLLLLFAGIVLGVRFIPFTVTSVSGTEITGPELIPEKLFPAEERTLLNLILTAVRGKKVPGIASWSISFEDLTSYGITVREEEAVAEIRSEGRFLILSETGAVLAAADEPRDGLTLINGCGISGGEPLSIPEVQDREAYQGLLTYASVLHAMGLSSSSLQYAGNYHLRLGLIDVELGTAEYAEEKIRVVREQEEYYEGLRGTLHLNNYRPGAPNEKYIFEVETEGAN